MHLGGLTDDLGRGECAAANDGQQRRRSDGDTFGDLSAGPLRHGRYTVGLLSARLVGPRRGHCWLPQPPCVPLATRNK
jgi:hypothetical protein